MGRHGGGSRSGGSSRSSRSSSRSSGGSRGGGSGVRTSSKPFKGCYNRSYYDRFGRLHTCYTSSAEFGTKSAWNVGIIFALIFLTCHMLLMLGAFGSSLVDFGGKVSGNPDRIFIADNANVLTDDEEKDIMTLLKDVYDTTKCLSDDAFDKLLNNFQKGMSGQNLADALDYAWNSVIDDLAKTKINWAEMPVLVIIVIFYGIFYMALLGGRKKQNDAYRYFKKNPDKLSDNPMVLYSDCPNCGASNATQNEVCPYCGSLLKISDGNKKFV